MCLEVLNAIEDANVLDLYAGSGALGLESLSRGAKSVTFVDKASACRKTIEKNIEKLNYIGLTKICIRDTCQFLSTTANSDLYDLVFIDPPYATNDETVYIVLEKLERLLNQTAVVILERSKFSKPHVPKNYKTLRMRTYGDSAVYFFSFNYA
jgi:16S rRNA (guanine966-N2)-methyltransferase